MAQEIVETIPLRTVNVPAEDISAELSRSEAESIVSSIKDDIASLRARIYTLWKRKGWKALGYESWEAFMEGEFKDLNKATVYRHVAAGRVEDVIRGAAENSPAGEGTDVLPEWVLRPLVKFKDDAEKLLRAWSLALELATKRGKDRPTGPMVEEAVELLFAEEEKASWPADELHRREIAEEGGAVLANMHKGQDEKLLEWAKENGRFIRIDRQSLFGNPYEMPQDGDRDEVCDAFPDYFQHKKSAIACLNTLNGKVLGCWCYPERCHGEHLIGLLEDPE